MNHYFRFLLFTVSVVLLSAGCTSDDKDIERQAYASSIGVDYIDGQFHCFIQFIDFDSISKAEGKKGKAKIWVGEGIGETFEDAVFELYRTSQERIYWGHLTAVVISESAFKRGFEGFYDLISRYYEFRRTPWVFAVREPISDILSAGGFYEQSPLSTILHEPEGVYAQSSTIKPIQLHRLIAEFYEPGYTSCIPVLSLDKLNWKENGENVEPKLMIAGAIFLKDQAYRSYMSLKELTGLHWVQMGSKRAGIPVPGDSRPSVQMIIEKPKTKLRLSQSEGGLQYMLEMKATGYIVSRFQNNMLNLQVMSEKTKEVIEKEIRELYQAGIEKKTDVLNLEHDLYRNHYRKWKSLAPVEEQLLKKNTLSAIHIDLDIEHSSAEKNSLIESK